MADNDSGSSADPGMPGSPGDPNVPSDAPEKGYPDAPAPKALPAQPDSTKPEDPYGPEHQVYLTQLKDLDRRAEARDTEIRQQLMPEIEKLQQIANQPAAAPPQPYAAPTPPTEQQKGGAAEFIVNLLKFGALAAIAFGTRGRASASLSKIAIGSALQGYAKGRKDVTEQALQVYEKNRQYTHDLNRDQNQEYHNILADRRMTLSQQMDIINSRARALGDLNTAEAARRQDLRAVMSSIENQKKLDRDMQKQEIKDRDKLYEMIGTKNFTAQYIQWLYEVSGGKVRLTINSDPDEWEKIVQEHPDWSVASFQAFLHQQELKRAEELSRAKKTGTEEGKEGAATEEKPSEQDKQKSEEDKAFRKGLMMPGE